MLGIYISVTLRAVLPGEGLWVSLQELPPRHLSLETSIENRRLGLPAAAGLGDFLNTGLLPWAAVMVIILTELLIQIKYYFILL